MKRTKQTKQLRLNIETVKTLTSRDLKRIIGGVDVQSSGNGCSVEPIRRIDVIVHRWLLVRTLEQMRPALHACTTDSLPSGAEQQPPGGTMQLQGCGSGTASASANAMAWASPRAPTTASSTATWSLGRKWLKRCFHYQQRNTTGTSLEHPPMFRRSRMFWSS